jgi:hypothetical protein
MQLYLKVSHYDELLTFDAGADPDVVEGAAAGAGSLPEDRTAGEGDAAGAAAAPHFFGSLGAVYFRASLLSVLLVKGINKQA